MKTSTIALFYAIILCITPIIYADNRNQYPESVAYESHDTTLNDFQNKLSIPMVAGIAVCVLGIIRFSPVWIIAGALLTYYHQEIDSALTPYKPHIQQKAHEAGTQLAQVLHKTATHLEEVNKK